MCKHWPCFPDLGQLAAVQQQGWVWRLGPSMLAVSGARYGTSRGRSYKERERESREHGLFFSQTDAAVALLPVSEKTTEKDSQTPKVRSGGLRASTQPDTASLSVQLTEHRCRQRQDGTAETPPPHPLLNLSGSGPRMPVHLQGTLQRYTTTWRETLPSRTRQLHPLARPRHRPHSGAAVPLHGITVAPCTDEPRGLAFDDSLFSE
ncbi:hypothetical protein EYF80_027692 [Liparis tanakae]|uniref:Uncharacterized protein n=1 Tax=Liparis tanakae TaxID=230148 RepID=A0A4Z2H998_9TELE|nr:hypothetical protein EYF80_027692 [Liparis tanakae]